MAKARKQPNPSKLGKVARAMRQDKWEVRHDEKAGRIFGRHHTGRTVEVWLDAETGEVRSKFSAA